jgi:hypothetical protein
MLKTRHLVPAFIPVFISALLNCVTVNDSQALATISFTADSSRCSESSGTCSLSVVLSNEINEPVSGYIDVISQSAVEGQDYAFPLPHTITFYPGEKIKIIDIQLFDDTIKESEKEVVFGLHALHGATEGMIIRHTLYLDDDSTDSYTILEQWFIDLTRIIHE